MTAPAKPTAIDIKRLDTMGFHGITKAVDLWRSGVLTLDEVTAALREIVSSLAREDHERFLDQIRRLNVPADLARQMLATFYETANLIDAQERAELDGRSAMRPRAAKHRIAPSVTTGPLRALTATPKESTMRPTDPIALADRIMLSEITAEQRQMLKLCGMTPEKFVEARRNHLPRLEGRIK
jgi:hypothetical protein